MRIGTWNVEYAYQPRLDAIRQTLVRHPADIWVLTETHDDLVPEGCGYAVHSADRPRSWSGIRPGSRWVSIWSAFPILRQVQTRDAKRTVAAVIDTPRGALLVYGTVLPWHSDRGDNPTDSVVPNWSEHHREIPDQASEWLDLKARERVDQVCVAGDYNTDMTTGRRYGTQKGIRMLQEGLAGADLFCATLPDAMPEGIAHISLIDHIALPRHWAPETKIEAAWPASKGELSDHSGVVVRVGL